MIILFYLTYFSLILTYFFSSVSNNFKFLTSTFKNILQGPISLSISTTLVFSINKSYVLKAPTHDIIYVPSLPISYIFIIPFIGQYLFKVFEYKTSTVS
jgi:hypothetical protein